MEVFRVIVRVASVALERPTSSMNDVVGFTNFGCGVTDPCQWHAIAIQLNAFSTEACEDCGAGRLIQIKLPSSSSC